MKSAWSYIINLILIIFIILLFTGVIDTRHSVKFSDQLKSFIQKNDVKAELAIDSNGNIHAVDKDGNPIPECSLGSDTKHPPCEGFGGTKGAVQSSQMYSIFRVKGSVCTTIIGATGVAYQLCY